MDYQVACMLGSANFSEYQSAYKKGHCSETALLEVLDRVYTAADNKQVTVLIGLDLSAAFDTVDHEILLQRLQSGFGMTDTPLCWLRSFLEGSEFINWQHLVCDTWLWDDMPLNSPSRSTLQCDM